MIGMRVASVYIDTSALLKCYLTEKNSNEVEDFLAIRFVENNANLVISTLSKLEWQCAMRRRMRAKEINAQYKQLALEAFNNQLASSYYQVLRVENAIYDKAFDLIERVTSALRTLDAVHLAIAQAAGIGEIITADKVMADAARELGFTVQYFE